MSVNTQDADDEDTFKILVATDNHLGYAEKDPIRGKDAMNTFEEILALAKEKEVDFILLGGDLFHDNKPSRQCIYDTMRLIRKYCMGDKPIQVQFLSDQSENFKHSSFPQVNFQDPNLNIAIPIFSIHGNHDDPTGMGNMCSLDLFSVTGLVNYFGKTTNLDQIQITPLLMQKGVTKLAIYGLGSVRGERLHRLFRDGLVSTSRPKEDEEAWFNLFVIHQNRVIRNLKDHVPGYFLDDYLDLIIWGHEHECRLKPEFEEWVSHKGFFISQPGSSVATQLAPGEAVPKQVGLLQINKKFFKMDGLPLKTVRQFYIEDIDLDDLKLPDNLDDDKKEIKIKSYLNEKVEQLLDKASLERIGNDKIPDKPLIRLRVLMKEKMKTFSVVRFGQLYVDKVANPKDMLKFITKRPVGMKRENGDDDFSKDQLQDLINVAQMDQIRVEDIVKEYFANARDDLQLSILSETGLRLAVQNFVDKGTNDSIKDLVVFQEKKVKKHLETKEVDDTTIDQEIHSFREERKKNVKDEVNETRKTLDEAGPSTNGGDDITFNSDTEEDMPPQTTRGRRGRGARGTSTRGRKNQANGDNLDVSTSATPKRGRGRGRGRAASAAASKSNTLDSHFARQPRGKAKKSFDDDDDSPPAQTTSSRAQSKTTKSQVTYISSSDSDF